jgi:predicted ester cyclase
MQMSEGIKNKFHRVVDEAWNRGNLDSLDELHSIGYVEHRPPFPDVGGLDAFKQAMVGAHLAFPDFHLTIDELILEGEKLAVRYAWTGTHSGQSPTLPIPPTGKRLTVTGLQIHHIDGDKLIETWQFADNLGLFQQLGLVPKPG